MDSIHSIYKIKILGMVGQEEPKYITKTNIFV